MGSRPSVLGSRGGREGVATFEKQAHEQNVCARHPFSTPLATHFGKVIRDDFKHNHLDLTNLMFGLIPKFEADPVEVFRTQANRLKVDGL